MHTFFINTSGNEIENYAEILDIQHEIRNLVSLDCPLSKWQSAEEGFLACVRKMGELIDSYKDINNSFNLIVYVDLIAFRDYTDIPMNEHRERYACLKVMRALLKHHIKSTMVRELDDCGRSPQEVLIIFEENKKPEDADEQTKDGKTLIQSYVTKFVGFPSVENVRAFAETFTQKQDEKPLTEWSQEVKQLFSSDLIGNVIDAYGEQITIFLREILENGNCTLALERLAERILIGACGTDETMETVSFITNRRAGITNKQERIRRDLRLSFYILDSVENESVFVLQTDAEGMQFKTVREFTDINWNKVAREILKKNLVFQKQYQETVSLSDSFTKMKLAPTLYAFDHEKFSLDEYGKRDQEFTVVDVTEEAAQNEGGEQLVGSVEKKAVVASELWVESLFTPEEFESFDYTGKLGEEIVPGKTASPETYITEARKLREHHVKYLKRLKIHITEALSNYAGRSLENEPALLRKRVVNLDGDVHTDSDKDRHYSTPDEAEETKKLDTVREIAQTAYESVVLDYMDFCAGRSVSVTDIEKQCDWFITRIHQIKESLRKVKAVAIGLLCAIVALYAPYVLVQWDAVVKSWTTGLIAVGSVLIPAAALFAVFAVASDKQRKKYAEAWKIFKEKSDAALEENKVAAKKYDQLLSVFIPALRWVYEYKVDVDFYAECCKFAGAKISHHKQKLQERITIIKNIVDDLELSEAERQKIEAGLADIEFADTIDYNVSYCSGQKNREFYSLVNKKFLETIQE